MKFINLWEAHVALPNIFIGKKSEIASQSYWIPFRKEERKKEKLPVKKQNL